MPRKQLTILAILNIFITATILFAWGHSLMPGDLSEEESSRALDLLRPFLEIIFGRGNVTDHLVRKLAHFSEYALLGCELCLRQQLLRAASQTAPAIVTTSGTTSTPAAAFVPVTPVASTQAAAFSPVAVPTPVAKNTPATDPTPAAKTAPAVAPILTPTSTWGGSAAPTAVPTPAANAAASIPWFMLHLRILALSLAVCFIDETIQLFVPGRGGRVEDMWIDMAGALTGLLFGLLINSIFRKCRRPSSPA